MQAQARKLSLRIVEGIQATKSAISSGTTSGWGSLALQELSGAIIGSTERFGGFDAMEATRATQPRPVNTKFGFVVTTAVGDEVAEANFKPATALSFATETLPERKVACITAFTSEVARHAPGRARGSQPRVARRSWGAAADRLFFRYVVDTVGAADIGGSGTAAVDIADDFRNALSAMDGSSRSRYFASSLTRPPRSNGQPSPRLVPCSSG
jgi:hypothetical protein